MADYRIADINEVAAEISRNRIPVIRNGIREYIPIPRPRKVALVLSGGGASGAFEAGVIESLTDALGRFNRENPENRIAIDLVLGTSTGSLNSYGIMLDRLRHSGVWTLPAWLEKSKGETINRKIWGYLGSFRSPARFVVDKPWLIRILYVFGSFRKTLAVAGLIVALLAAAVAGYLPFRVFGAEAGASGGRLQLAAACGLAGSMVLAGWFLLSLLMNRWRLWGRPLSGFLCGSLLGGVTAGAGRALGLALTRPGAVFNSICAAAGLVVCCGFTVYSIVRLNGDAVFGNSRLLRLIAALGDSNSKSNRLRSPVTAPKAEKAAAAGSAVLSGLIAKDPQQIAGTIFTAANITAERQGLFYTGPDPVSVQLLQHGWLCLPIGNSPDSGVSGDRLAEAVIASTAIPAIYPAEVMDYRFQASRFRHTFVDGGLLDFAAYHAAIDAGATHIISVETDCINYNLMERSRQGDRPGLFQNIFETLYTAVDARAVAEAGRVSATNRLVLEGASQKNLIQLIRIAPSLNERMIDAQEFDGRYVNGKLKHSLTDWMAYGERVDPDSGYLPPVIWYHDAEGRWACKTTVEGPLIWDGSICPAPGSDGH